MAEKPKRPLSAYMIWLNDHREQIKKENPGIKVTEIAKRGGELWRALKDKSVSVFFIVTHTLLYVERILISFLCNFDPYRSGIRKPLKLKTDTQS